MLARVQSDPQTTDGAYQLARDWAGRVDLPLGPLERWVRERHSCKRDEQLVEPHGGFRSCGEG